MGRNLSLSQAARLIGVTRKDIQKKIQQNKLPVMEGTVLLEDLKAAYPNAEYEDNTMLEKTQKLMADAVYKMAQSEHEGAQLNALSRRAHRLNQELVVQKAKAQYLEDVLNQLKQKFVQLSTSKNDISVITELQQWLQETLDNGAPVQSNNEKILSQQIEQFMQPHVRLLPSRHDFISDKSQTLLESALASGLAVDYGCNNGRCGKCKVKLLSGQVKACRHSDYVFNQEEKLQNSILTCVNSAVTDVVLETHEAVSVDDIPKQNIKCKIRSLDAINQTTYILNLKTPRSQRLRFLAGQRTKLSLDQQSINLDIASCPCDARNIQFHFKIDNQSDIIQNLISGNNSINEIDLEGPEGHFILDENSPRSMVFIAEGVGFAAIKSLTENALAMDLDSHIHLIWIVASKDGHYMDNLCRSWNDALDNFSYLPIISKKNTDINQQISRLLLNKDISGMLSQALHDYDFYISTRKNLGAEIKKYLLSEGCGEEQLHINQNSS